jgi:hypothetical protein
MSFSSLVIQKDIFITYCIYYISHDYLVVLGIIIGSIGTYKENNVIYKFIISQKRVNCCDFLKRKLIGAC